MLLRPTLNLLQMVMHPLRQSPAILQLQRHLVVLPSYMYSLHWYNKHPGASAKALHYSLLLQRLEQFLHSHRPLDYLILRKVFDQLQNTFSSDSWNNKAV